MAGRAKTAATWVVLINVKSNPVASLAKSKEREGRGSQSVESNLHDINTRLLPFLRGWRRAGKRNVEISGASDSVESDPHWIRLISAVDDGEDYYYDGDDHNNDFSSFFVIVIYSLCHCCVGGKVQGKGKEIKSEKKGVWSEFEQLTGWRNRRSKASSSGWIRYTSCGFEFWNVGMVCTSAPRFNPKMILVFISSVTGIHHRSWWAILQSWDSGQHLLFCMENVFLLFLPFFFYHIFF